MAFPAAWDPKPGGPVLAPSHQSLLPSRPSWPPPRPGSVLQQADIHLINWEEKYSSHVMFLPSWPVPGSLPEAVPPGWYAPCHRLSTGSQKGYSPKYLSRYITKSPLLKLRSKPMFWNTRILFFANQEILKWAEVVGKDSYKGSWAKMEEMEAGNNLLKFKLVMWVSPDQPQCCVVWGQLWT